MVLVFLAIVIILPLGILVGYQYLKVVTAPVYNAATMSLNYETIGVGEKKLLLLHGMAGSKNYWKKDLEKIDGTHQLLLVDLLGFGDSPEPYSNYSLDVQLGALEKIILKEGFEKGNTALVGHSLGAILAFALLAKRPSWFKGIAVIGLPVFTNKKQFIQNMSQISFFDRLSVSPFSKLVCMFKPLYMVSWLKPDNLTTEVFADAKKHTWLSFSNSLNEVMLKTDLYSIAKNIKNKKILFIQGEKDRVAPVANVKKFAELFPDAIFNTVKDGDHQLFLKTPDKVWNLINQYL
jgi:pimeloyl-ACP methyl ester carboxylesterase